MASGTNARGTRLDRAEHLGRSQSVRTGHRRSPQTPRAALAFAAAAALAGTALLNIRSAYATSDTWDGQTSNAWATNTNWATDPAVVPGTGDTATFNSAGNGNTLIDLGGGVTINAIVFDAGAASFTIGSSAGQSLSLDSGGAITMNSGVTSDQTIGVAGTTLSLSSAAAAGATFTNNSTSLLTIGANVVANNASGNGVLNVDGSGNTLVTGTITEPGAGANALFKRGAGTLTLTNGSAWSGAGAVQTAFSGPFTVQEGTLRLNGGTHAVTGEAVIGGVVAHGGAGQNARVQVDAGSLTVNNWLSVGRGNGVGGVTSELVLNNNATVSAVNLSGGFNAGNTANLPRVAVTQNDTSTFTVTNNNANYNWGESAGSYATMTLNGSSTMTHNGAASGTRIGMAGTGILNITSPTATANVRNLIIGQGGNGVGAVYNRGTLLSINLDGLFLGDGANSSSYFLNDNAAAPVPNATAGNIVAGIGATSNAVVDVASGTIGANRVGTGFFNNNTNNGQFNVTGGTLAAGATGFQVADTAARTGVKWGNVNVTGGGTFSSTGPINLSLPNLANTGVVSVASGGTVVADTITAGGTTPNAIVNFDGGTLKAQGSTPSLVTANVDRVTVYGGGLTVDTNGVNKSIDTVVAAPADSGISGITLAATGTAYEGRPIVQITDPTGTGATAMADFDVATGQVTGVTITSPGSGYTAPTVSILGGGGAGVTGTATLGSVTSGGLTKTGAGTLMLNSANTYTGATTVTGGSLFVGGAGDINTSSSITVSGSGARFGSASSVPVSQTVTVTNGGVDGTGTLNTVNVAGNPANTIFNGNGGTGTLTIGTLELAGAANFNLNVGGTAPVVATTTLNTNGTDNVLVNASNTLWTEGTYNLISYSTLGGSGFAAFEKGTISGLSGRQSAALTNPAGFIALMITGDNPRWSGAFSNEWSTATHPNPKNWQLISSGAPTDYIQGDIVLFDDNATTTNPTISVADVSPSSVLFENSAKNYTISGTFSIAGATGVSKSGTGALTIANANTYSGGTTLNSGTLNINNANALGTGALNVANGATIDNTSGSPVTLANNAQVWNGDVTFGGTNALNMGTRAIARPGSTALTVNGAAPVTIAGVIPGPGAVTKAGPGTLVFTGNNTYTGATVVRGGDLQVPTGTTGVLAADVNIAPEPADVATMTVSGGTLNANRVVIAGASANNTSPGTAVLNHSAGTINSQQWFTVGSGGSAAGNTGGSGTYNFSGGTLNVIGQQMEVANFTGSTGTVNMSGNATLNVRNNLVIRMGANPNSGNGTFTQDGGNVTFYPDAAGTTPGGNGVLFIGGAGTLTSTHTYNLNGGTLTVPQIQRNTANQATANFNFNGGTLKAARANPTMMFGLTRANVRNGGAIIDTNGFDVAVAQPLLHSDIGGDAAIDGGLTKNGAGALTLGGAATYTGATVINGGTLRLPTYVAPVAVGNYTFDELPDGGLNAGTAVANAGTGGAAMNGAVNHADNPLADPSSTTVVAGRFGKAITFDGLGSSVDVANRIVDQAGAGSWTFSTWLKTNQVGSSIMVKNASGNTWAAGHSEFYLGSNPIGPNGANSTLPTAVRNAGGFVQGNQPVADDAWHMITFVADGGVRSVFVDGVQVALNFADFTTADTATTTRFGYHGNTVAGDGGVNLAGTLDEMKFFTGSLTAAQVQELFTSNTVTPIAGKQYLPTATAVSMTASGTTLELGDNSQTIGSLSGVAGSAVALGAGTLTTGGSNTSTAFAGNIGGTGGVTKVGTGTQTLSGTNTYTGGTNVQAGTLRVVRLHQSNPVSIAGGKLQVIDSSPTLPSHPSGDNAFVSRPSSLTINNNGAAIGSRTYSGQLDLGNNDLILDYDGASNLAEIEDMVRAGYNGGDWLGNGIASSTANANRNFAIGVADNARLTIPFSASRLFSGQVVDATTILVKFTHRIDLDLDGVITTNDATIFNSNYTEGAPAYWSIGDLDYDRVFTTNDATLFNSFYSEALASVPEPATLGVLGLAGAGLLLRRRRRQQQRADLFA